MIETDSPAKTFTIKKVDIAAVKDLALSIPEGEVFGSRGAGKAHINGFGVGVQDQDVRRPVGIPAGSFPNPEMFGKPGHAPDFRCPHVVY